MSVNWTQDEMHAIKKILASSPSAADLPRVREQLRELGVRIVYRVHLGRVADAKFNSVEEIPVEIWGGKP